MNRKENRKQLNERLTRKQWIILLLVFSFCLFLSIGIVFAYNQLVFRSNPQTITANSVYFKATNGEKLNDGEYKYYTFQDDIATKDLGKFSRGEERNVIVGVEVTTKEGSLVEINYTVNFSVTGNLSSAVEVYLYTETGYTYLCMLNQLKDYPLEGVVVANQENEVADLRLVYSPAANSIYNDTDFQISASVQGSLSSSSYVGNVLYVDSLSDLSPSSYQGKVIRLLKDITLSQNVTLSEKVAIDLNGHTLSVVNNRSQENSLIINYQQSVSSDTLCGIYNSKQTGQFLGNLKVIDSGEDLFLIGDNVKKSEEAVITFGTGANGSIALTNSMLKGFFKTIDYNYSHYIENKTFTMSGEEDNPTVIPFLNNLSWMLTNANSYFKIGKDSQTNIKIVYNFQDDLVEYDEENHRCILNKNTLYTNSYAFSFISNDSQASSKGAILICGNSPYAVANYYISQLENLNTISASLFFPTYDQASGVSLTWVVEDHNEGNLLDSDGAYLKNGYTSLQDWAAQSVSICLLASNKQGNQASKEIKISVSILSEQQRTAILYTTSQLVLTENDIYTFYSSDDEESSAIDTRYLSSSHLKSIRVNLGGLDETNKLNASDYFSYQQEDGNKIWKLQVLKSPISDSATFNLPITFIYQDSDSSIEKSWTIYKKVTLLGGSQSVGLENAQNILQGWLDETPYVKKSSQADYDLSIQAYLSSTGNNVEYKLSNDSIGYVNILENVYKQNLSGNYYRIAPNQYVYFSELYQRENQQTEGAVQGEDGYWYSVTDNRSNAYILDKQEESIKVYKYSTDNCFKKTATISVIPEKVPANDVVVNLDAYLYITQNNIKKYCLTDGNYASEEEINTHNQSVTPEEKWSKIKYNITFTVYGIYHNNDQEIKENSLYTVLKEYYDLNGDGFISKQEALSVWEKKDNNWYLTNGQLISKAYTSPYIDASGLKISSLKGIEYFKYALGYDFSNNSINEIGYLKNLTHLQQILFKNNLITDISSIAYLDELSSIDFSQNNVTSIESLRYLSNLNRIDLNGQQIIDYSPLSNLKKISYLDITSVKDILDTSLYNIALIYKNAYAYYQTTNVDFSIITSTATYNSIYNQSSDWQEILDQAQALFNLSKIGSVYKTVYLPTIINYQQKNYYITWSCDVVAKNYLQLGTSSSSTAVEKPLDYVIVTPAVDLYATLTASISTDASTTGTVARSFDIVLLSDRSAVNSNLVYIEDENENVFVLAEEIPDKALRSVIFSTFNTNDTGSATIVLNGETISIDEKQILRYSEIQAYNTTQSFNWNNQGIQDLTGIGYVKDVFQGEQSALYLQANKLYTDDNGYADISPLAQLQGLKTLKLGGQAYDFSQLLNISGEGTEEKVEGITSLKQLYVCECYDLDKQTVLEGLYKVYLKNIKVNIYIEDESTIWDPYSKLLSYYVQELPSAYAFLDKNQKKELMNGIKEGGKAYCDFTFYNYKTIRFYPVAYSIQGNTSNKYSLTSVIENSVNYYTSITYQNVVGKTETDFLKLTIQGNDERSNISYSNYNIELFSELNEKIRVLDKTVTADTSNLLQNSVSIHTLFNSITLKKEILNRIFSANQKDSLSSLLQDKTGYFVKDGYTYITYDSLKNLSWGSSIVIDGTYEGDNVLKGLSLLSLDKIELTRDVDLKDGSELVNLQELKIANSYLDFSKICHSLPNLKKLQISYSNTPLVLCQTNNNGKYYEFTYENGKETYLIPDYDYYLRYFPNIENLYLLNNNISDWTFLFGLFFQDIESEDANGETIHTQTLKATQGSQGNLKIGSYSIEDSLKILQIYNNNSSYCSSSSSGNKISFGTINGKVEGTYSVYSYNESGDLEEKQVTYNAENNNNQGFGIVSALYRACNSTPNYYLRNGTVTYVMTDYSYLFKVDAKKDYEDFYGTFIDSNATISNGTKLVENITQKLTSGESITLPLNTYSFFGTQFSDSSLFTRAYGIEWSIHGVSSDLTISGASLSNNISSLNYQVKNYDLVNLTADTYKNASITLNFTCNKDYYFILVGTLGNTYFTPDGKINSGMGGTTVKFVYPILLTNSSDSSNTSFKQISDSALRFALFCALADENYDGTLSAYVQNGASACNYLNLVYSPGSTTDFKVSQLINNKASEVANRKPTTLFEGAISLNTCFISLQGLDKLTALTTISLQNFPLTNLESLQNCSNLTKLTIQYAALESIPVLSNRILYLYLPNNNICGGLENLKALTSLKELNLSNNDISSDSLSDCFNPKNDTSFFSASIGVLNFSANECVHTFSFVEWCSFLFSDNNYLNNRITLNGTWGVNKTSVDALKAVLIGQKDVTNNKYNLGFRSYDKENETWAEFCQAVDEAPGVYSDDLSNLSTTSSISLASNWSMSFFNSFYCKAENRNYLFVNGSFTASLKIYSSSGNLWIASWQPIYKNVTFYQEGANSKSIQGKGEYAGNTYTVDTLDSGFWSYLVNKGYVDIQNEKYVINVQTLNIYENWNIQSLKGLNYFGFTQISISGNPYISKLWDDTKTFSSLTKLSIYDCAIPSNEFLCLKNSVNCKYLNLTRVSQLDNASLSNNQSFANVINLTVLGSDFYGKTTTVGEDSLNETYQALYNNTGFVAGYNLSHYSSLHLSSYINEKNTEIKTDRGCYDYWLSQLSSSTKSKIFKFTSLSQTNIKNNIFICNSDFDQTYFLFEKSKGSRSNETQATDGIISLYLLSADENYLDLEKSSKTYTLPSSIQYRTNNYSIVWSLKKGDTTLNNFNGDLLVLSTENILNWAEDVDGKVSSSITITLRATYNKKDVDFNIIISNIPTENQTITQSINYQYYIETDDNGTCVPAKDIFESGRFVEWIFKGVNAKDVKYGNNVILDANGTQIKDSVSTHGVSVIVNGNWGIVPSAVTDGHSFTYKGVSLTDSDRVLPYDLLKRIYSVDMTRNGDAVSLGITSLKGIEVFVNLKKVYFNGGAFIDIQPLENLSLEVFSYRNTDNSGTYGYYIEDFTPLVKGSKNSLSTFIYNGSAEDSIIDYTFLLSFKNLKNIYLFGSSPENIYNISLSSKTSRQMLNYLETQTFKYLVSELNRKNVNLYLDSATTSAKLTIKTFLNSSSWKDNYTVVYESPYYHVVLTPFATNNISMEILNSFNQDKCVNYADDYEYDGGTYINFVDAVQNENCYTGYLPALLNKGNFYPIEWDCISNLIQVDLAKDDISYQYEIIWYKAAKIGTYNKNAGDTEVLKDYDALEKFVNENESQLYLLRSQGKLDIRVKVKITLPQEISTKICYIMMRTKVNDYWYERLFMLDLSSLNKSSLDYVSDFSKKYNVYQNNENENISSMYSYSLSTITNKKTYNTACTTMNYIKDLNDLYEGAKIVSKDASFQSNLGNVLKDSLKKLDLATTQGSLENGTAENIYQKAYTQISSAKNLSDFLKTVTVADTDYSLSTYTLSAMNSVLISDSIESANKEYNLANNRLIEIDNCKELFNTWNLKEQADESLLSLANTENYIYAKTWFSNVVDLLNQGVSVSDCIYKATLAKEILDSYQQAKEYSFEKSQQLAILYRDAEKKLYTSDNGYSLVKAQLEYMQKGDILLKSQVEIGTKQEENAIQAENSLYTALTGETVLASNCSGIYQNWLAENGQLELTFVNESGEKIQQDSNLLTYTTSANAVSFQEIINSYPQLEEDYMGIYNTSGKVGVTYAVASPYQIPLASKKYYYTTLTTSSLNDNSTLAVWNDKDSPLNTSKNYLMTNLISSNIDSSLEYNAVALTKYNGTYQAQNVAFTNPSVYSGANINRAVYSLFYGSQYFFVTYDWKTGEWIEQPTNSIKQTLQEITNGKTSNYGKYVWTSTENSLSSLSTIVNVDRWTSFSFEYKESNKEFTAKENKFTYYLMHYNLDSSGYVRTDGTSVFRYDQEGKYFYLPVNKAINCAGAKVSAHINAYPPTSYNTQYSASSTYNYNYFVYSCQDQARSGSDFKNNGQTSLDENYNRCFYFVPSYSGYSVGGTGALNYDANGYTVDEINYQSLYEQIAQEWKTTAGCDNTWIKGFACQPTTIAWKDDTQITSGYVGLYYMDTLITEKLNRATLDTGNME